MNPIGSLRISLTSLTVVFTLLAAPSAFAQPLADSSSPLRVLHSFADPGLLSPSSIVQLADGTLYGRARFGAPQDSGGFFKIGTDGTYTILGGDSSLVAGGPSTLFLRGLDGNLYGTTGGFNTGADGNAGTIFRMTPTGVVTRLHSFKIDVDGFFPGTLVEGTGGTFYGTTTFGGPSPVGTSAFGTVFAMTADGQLRVLHTFRSDRMSVEGATPTSLAVDPAGQVFGTTSFGTQPSGGGTVFRILTDGSFTVLHTFTDLSWAGNLVEDASVLYGTLRAGFPGLGVNGVFRLTGTGAFSVLHDFGANESATNLVKGSDGRLYGVTSLGTAFALAVDGTYVPLHGFPASDGSVAYSLSPANDGGFVGTASYGGAFGSGAAFTMSIIGDVSVLHSFGGVQDGASPTALIQSPDELFFGATSRGGIFAQGTIFQMTADGNVNVLHALTSRDGYGPHGLSAAADDGVYWAGDGGSAFPGGAFRKTARDGTTTVVFGLPAGSPFGFGLPAVIQARNGGFLGTIFTSGVFRVDRNGTLTLLHRFIGNDGYEPAALLEGEDGFLYGTTELGGIGWFPGFGTIFRMDQSGTVTPLHLFSGIDGSNPLGLIQGRDGNLYGFGGEPILASMQPVLMPAPVFKVTTGGIFTLLHTFSGPDAAVPNGLIQATDGNLYGTTKNGGAFGLGMVFRMTPEGETSVVHSFSGPDGAGPSALIQAKDGNLYGTTASGGASGTGAVFRIAATDGSVSAAGGTVTDTATGSRARVIVPPGVLTGPTQISIVVLPFTTQATVPGGYSAFGTYFVTIELAPTPPLPLAAPGLTIVLPVQVVMTPGSRLDLFRVDPVTGVLVPSLDTAGKPISGTVDADGLSATFTGISHLSTLVGLVPVPDTTPPELTLPIDIVVPATGATGAGVTYQASALDAVDGAVAIHCSPASGSTFAMGVTTVQCFAVDTKNNRADGSFTVTVLNHPPVAVDDTASTLEGVAVDIDVLVNDTDVDGGVLTVTTASLPAHGTASISGGGIIRYIPSPGYFGTDAFTYTITDGQGGSASATVTTYISRLGRFVALGIDHLWLRPGVRVVTGDVAANRAAAASEEDDEGSVEVRIGQRAALLAAGSRVIGDTVRLDAGASVFDVLTNALINHRGIVRGSVSSLGSLPFVPLPLFPTVTPGTNDILVHRAQVLTLGPGRYGIVHVRTGGTLIMSGGLYEMVTLDLDRQATVLGQGAAELRIAEELDTASRARIVVDGMNASDLKIYVRGDDAICRHDGHDEDEDDPGPTAVHIGERNTIQANIYAPNGTIWIKDRSNATGAFIGRRVRVGEQTELTLNSAFK